MCTYTLQHRMQSITSNTQHVECKQKFEGKNSKSTIENIVFRNDFIRIVPSYDDDCIFRLRVLFRISVTARECSRI